MSMIMINDCLQLTAGQGFPEGVLDINKHLSGDEIKLEDVKGRAFAFNGKPGIRVFQQPPVRCSFIQNIKVNGVEKWIYWGTCVITETMHDNINQTTSGKFEIVTIHTPEEMKTFFKLRDGRKGFDYFDKI